MACSMAIILPLSAAQNERHAIWAVLPVLGMQHAPRIALLKDTAVVGVMARLYAIVVVKKIS